MCEEWQSKYLSARTPDDPILLCSSTPSPQRGTLAVSLDGSLCFNGSLAAFLFSTPSGGKTY